VTEPVPSSYSVAIKTIAMRILAAEKVMNELVENPEDPFALQRCELAVLQIRLVCELLMLGCQMAHLEDAGAEIANNKWRPVDAYAQLKDLSEHPLPMPVAIEYNKNGMGQHHIKPLSKPIPFAAISRLYGVCGDLLHAPTIKKVLSGKLPEFDVGLLRHWLGELRQLIGAHALMLPERKIVFLSIWDGSFENEPQLFRLDAAGESTFDLASYPDCELLS